VKKHTIFGKKKRDRKRFKRACQYNFRDLELKLIFLGIWDGSPINQNIFEDVTKYTVGLDKPLLDFESIA
jgi:hypothetical protein